MTLFSHKYRSAGGINLAGNIAEERFIDMRNRSHEPIVSRVARHQSGYRVIHPGHAVVASFVALLLATSMIGLPLAGRLTQSAYAQNDEAIEQPATPPTSQIPIDEALAQAHFAGCDAVLAWRAGQTPSIEALQSVDIEALRAIDSAFAATFEAYVESRLNASGEDPDDAADAADPAGSDPAAPGTSGEAAGAGNTSGTTQPVNPDGSTEPAAPDDPSAPSGADQPTDPNTPATPDSPTQPADPNTPETPENPDTGSTNPAPDAPALPVEPEQSAPAQPNTSSQDRTPAWSYEGDTTYVPHHYTHNFTTEKFIAVIGELARQIGQENNLYASVMIAQAILESGSGNSTLSQAPYNNLFGIKGSFNGKSVSMSTREDDGTGSTYSIVAPFRAYDTLLQSMNDYAALIRHGLNGYYAMAWKENAPTYVQACNYLEGRYATDTSYSEKLQDLIVTYDLTRFDAPLDYEPVTPLTMQIVDPTTKRPLFDLEGNPITKTVTLADLVAETTSHLGTPYVWGGTSPDEGFDCSGLVQYSYREAIGIDIPRTTQYQCLVGQDVNFADLHMGDLVFFASESKGVYHVGMYLGDGYYIEAPRSGDVVKVTAMEEKMPTFAKRVIATKPVTQTFELPELVWPSAKSIIDV